MSSTVFRVLLACAILSVAVYQLDAAELSWEAEHFAASNGDKFEVLHPPFKTQTNSDTPSRAKELIDSAGEPILDYTIEGPVYSDAFVGTPSGTDGSWLKYEFTVPQSGAWYFWGRVVAPTIGDNSFFWGVDIADADAKNADDNNVNIWDFYEVDDATLKLRERYTTKWVWFRLNSRSGNPFKGTEVDQYGPNPTPLELTAGKHTMHIISREKSYLDIMYATTDKGFDANGTPPVSVEPQNKLTTTWGALKLGF